MSVKEEKFLIFEEFDTGDRHLITDMHDSLIVNVKKVDVDKDAQKALVNSEKNILAEKITESNDYIIPNSFNCSVCQNTCSKCKSICVTCKYPCQKCILVNNVKNSSTDTDDFDKYLESQYRKLKLQPKVKAIGIDTCDLEGHFDYYKLEKKIVRIQKNVSTDCLDLNARKITVTKPLKNTVATDTNDLMNFRINADVMNDSFSEFLWDKKEENKISYNSATVTSSSKFISKQLSSNLDADSLGIDEENDCASLLSLDNQEKEDDKENLNINKNTKEITFDSASTSDESDVDLNTFCKLSKCRQIARKHKITLKQINKENQTLYKCCICNKSFPKKILATIHLANHIEEDKFKCLSCSEHFTSLDLLLSHIQDLHSSDLFVKEKSQKTILDSETVTNNQKPKVGKIYQCSLCPSENEFTLHFNSYKALYLHKKIKHGVDKTKCAEVRERRVRVKREFICLICGKQFKSSKALKDHSPVHTGEKNYHCDICKKSYTTSANLKIHKRTHTGVSNFVCTVCNKAFRKKDSLKVHFRKHSGERPFQCDLCPMKFDRNYILKNHRYTHFSEKTFICPVCGKTFTTHGGLNNHEKSHTKDPFAKKPRKPAVKPTLDAEKAVICDVCGKIYSTKSNLRVHKFVHLGVKPFECTICHQTYAKKDSMLIHMRKHTDERPFACETCGMTFYRNHTLKTHLLRHTGERPHKCKMCGKGFTQSSSLAYHLRNHDKKMEKKENANGQPKPKKKKPNIGNGKSNDGAQKKATKFDKQEAEYSPDEPKNLLDEKKCVEGGGEVTVLNLPEKEAIDIAKGGHFMLPVSDKEVLILDKSFGVELPKSVSAGKELDFLNLDKDRGFGNQCGLTKFNYYIAKNHVLSLPKDGTKSKLEKCGGDIENLIISKNSYITKEGTLVTLNKESSLKEVKEEFLEFGNQRLDLKGESVPLAGEILNATFISDENGDVLPFGSMTLQGLNPDNVMISHGSVITVESDDVRRRLARNPKVMYSVPTTRIPLEKSPNSKGGCRILNLKEQRIPQKIHIELESSTLQLQPSTIEDGALQGIPVFYNSVQQNEI